MTVTKGGRRFQGIQSGLERANEGKAKPVWYSDLWVLLSAVSVSQHFFGEFLQPLWVYAFLSDFDKQWVSFAHSPAFSAQSEWRRRGKEGERKGRRKRGWVGRGWEGETGGKKDVEEDRKCGEGYTWSSNVHITMQVIESHNILPQKSLSPRISNRYFDGLSEQLQKFV